KKTGRHTVVGTGRQGLCLKHRVRPNPWLGHWPGHGTHYFRRGTHA
ncbi:hypothetical protein A2U01_0105479, partial [Trifolium medium]|nr:hypothetical protein [Trifolium medium]